MIGQLIQNSFIFNLICIKSYAKASVKNDSKYKNGWNMSDLSLNNFEIHKV